MYFFGGQDCVGYTFANYVHINLFSLPVLRKALKQSLKRNGSDRIEWFIDSEAYLPTYDLAPPPPPTLLPSVSSTGDTREDWERETSCWLQRGRGTNHYKIIRRRESLDLHNSFNTLWVWVMLALSPCWQPRGKPHTPQRSSQSVGWI